MKRADNHAIEYYERGGEKSNKEIMYLFIFLFRGRGRGSRLDASYEYVTSNYVIILNDLTRVKEARRGRNERRKAHKDEDAPIKSADKVCC